MDILSVVNIVFCILSAILSTYTSYNLTKRKYKDYSEISIDYLSDLAEDNFNDLGIKKYILCMRTNNNNIYGNIYLASIVINFTEAVNSNNAEPLKKILRGLSHEDGLDKATIIPTYITLDIFNPYEPNGKTRYGKK